VNENTSTIATCRHPNRRHLSATLAATLVTLCACTSTSPPSQQAAVSESPSSTKIILTTSEPPERPPPPVPVPVRRVTPPRSSAATPLQQPPYSDESRRNGERGIVGVRVYVLENGRVGDVRIQVSTGYASLDAETVRTAKSQWRLAPGTINGRPTAMWAIFAITFGLEGVERRDQSAELEAQRLEYAEYLNQLEAAAAQAP
jgi:TonB family protein